MAQHIEPFHIGVIVPDIHAAIAAYRDGAGMSFTQVKDITLEVLVDGEQRTEAMYAAYSKQAPYVELIEERSGGIWGAEHFNLNHAGCWTDDLNASVAELEKAGFVKRITALGDPARMCYLAGPGNVWVELCGPPIREMLAQWLTTDYEGPDAPLSVVGRPAG